MCTRTALTKQRPYTSSNCFGAEQHALTLCENEEEDDAYAGSHAGHVSSSRTEPLLTPSAEEETDERARDTDGLICRLPVGGNGFDAVFLVSELFLEGGKRVERVDLRSVSRQQLCHVVT